MVDTFITNSEILFKSSIKEFQYFTNICKGKKLKLIMLIFGDVVHFVWQFCSCNEILKWAWLYGIHEALQNSTKLKDMYSNIILSNPKLIILTPDHVWILELKYTIIDTAADGNTKHKTEKIHWKLFQICESHWSNTDQSLSIKNWAKSN